MKKEIKTILGNININEMTEHDIDNICRYITIRANKMEIHNRNGICDYGVIGFVRGLRWCVSFLKSIKKGDFKK